MRGWDVLSAVSIPALPYSAQLQSQPARFADLCCAKQPSLSFLVWILILFYFNKHFQPLELLSRKGVPPLPRPFITPLVLTPFNLSAPPTVDLVLHLVFWQWLRQYRISIAYTLNAEAHQDCILAAREEEDAHAHRVSAVSVSTEFVWAYIVSLLLVHFLAEGGYTTVLIFSVLVLALGGNLAFLVCCSNTVWKGVMVWIIIFQTNLIHWFPWDEDKVLFHPRCT